ncbi:hypothetical protein P8882_10625 [Bacillus haynesii]|nr:hypothetical protein [Bacillus haynesii]
MESVFWRKGSELGTHCYAPNPFYSVHTNGKVDINPERGNSTYKIELRTEGMYRLVSDWLSSNHLLSDDERELLINKLSTNGNKIYNTITKEWEKK